MATMHYLAPSTQFKTKDGWKSFAPIRCERLDGHDYHTNHYMLCEGPDWHRLQLAVVNTADERGIEHAKSVFSDLIFTFNEF